MKKFEAPEMEIATFAIEDVITTSGEEEIPTPSSRPNESEIG